ncbi:GNAT family N-acetyltransferase [Nonomuraea sediminis]|uniref:GNAT family N-acetyltransferase n=1 Tax=Nonomuraea sediminis TaxID=2835864 RepID=UPI001BDD4E78|nr:GNAT family N-acetyltransferase [Nonomuraea sediminis]
MNDDVVKAGSMRLARESDQKAVEEIVFAAYEPWVEIVGMRPLPMEADYGKLIAEQRVHLTGDIDGLIVLIPEDGALYIDNVAVRPQMHGKGVGRELLAFAEDEARRLGLPATRLITNVKMLSNRALYARLGYQEVGFKGVEGRQAVEMRKELS